jgi:hypothetical protein
MWPVAAGTPGAGHGAATQRSELRLPAAQDAVVTVDVKFCLSELFRAGKLPDEPGGYSVEIDVTGGTLAAFAVVNDNVTSDGA